jgi:hypothetical protein
MSTYRLGSSGLVFAPGVVRWAMAAYAFPADRAVGLGVITEGWGVPETAAVALLSKAAPHTVEGDTVVFEA